MMSKREPTPFTAIEQFSLLSMFPGILYPTHTHTHTRTSKSSWRNGMKTYVYFGVKKFAEIRA